jgi:hypothetical protein
MQSQVRPDRAPADLVPSQWSWMMSTNEQHNTVIGSGNIMTGGTINNSPMTSTTVNSGAGAGSQTVWVGRLAGELARAHECLAGRGLPVTPDLAHAVAAIEELQGQVAAFQKELASGHPPGPEKQKKLRDRVDALLRVLLPVAEMIGGIAGFQDILHHLG